MNTFEKALWHASGQFYEVFRVSMSMEDSRARLVTQLRLMADEIEDMSRTPSGSIVNNPT